MTKKWRLLLPLLLLAAFLTAVLTGFFQINRTYPEAVHESYPIGASLTDGHLTYTVTSWKLITMEEIRRREPQYQTSVVAPGGGLCTDDQIRCLTATLVVSSDADGQKVIPYRLIPESRGWYNEMDLEAFYILNDNPVTQLDNGESTTLVLPFFLYEFHFRRSDWANIDTREFDLVLTTYPVKRSFSLSY